MDQHQKEKITYELLNTLQPLVLADKIEILAQVMIHWGIGNLLKDFPELMKRDESLTHEELIELVANDKRNGETLGGALAHQGLIMLMWLSSGENNEQFGIY